MLSTTLPKVPFTLVAQHAHHLYASKTADGRPVPVMLHGHPGHAKTTLIHTTIREHVARLTGKPVQVIHELLATREATDIRGIPFPITRDAEGKSIPPVTMWTRPDLSQKIERVLAADPDTIVILLFDEWGQASPDLQKAAIPIFDGYIGDYKLPPNVWVWGTSNFQDDGAGVSKTLAHGLTRVAHFPGYLPVDDWVKDYAQPHALPAAGVLFAKSQRAVFEGDSVDYKPPMDGPSCNYRSFTYWLQDLRALKAAQGITDERVIPDDSFTRAVCRSKIGTQMADLFFALGPMLELLPSVEEICQDWAHAKLPAGRDAYAQYAVQSVLINAMLSGKLDTEGWFSVLNYATRLKPELAGGIYSTLHDPRHGINVMLTPEVNKWIKDHVGLFVALSQA